jgi:hypothetical protein
MHTTTQTDFGSTSRQSLGGTTARASESDDTAQPPLTSGFGTVMEQERDIQAATGAQLGTDHSPQSAAIDRILRDQQAQLGANIALLEQRYETLPQPERFQALPPEEIRLSHSPRPAGATMDRAVFLPNLIEQHLNLLRHIEALIARRPDGQRGEIILAEIARNHEDMAWMLTALIKEDEFVRDSIAMPTIARGPGAALAPSEANWENEGGASQGVPPVK